MINFAEAYRLKGNQEAAMAAAREAVLLASGDVNRMMLAHAQLVMANVLLDHQQYLEAAPRTAQYLT